MLAGDARIARNLAEYWAAFSHTARANRRKCSELHTNKEGGDAGVLRWLQLGQVVDSTHHLLGHRVIHSEVAVLDILVGQLPCRRHFVPVRTLSAPLALPLDEEAADWGPISLHKR